MPQYEPIKDNKDFRRIYRRGRSFVGPALVCYVLRGRHGAVRAGITTSKRIGNAVQRNRSRRVIRAAFAALAPRVKLGYDFIFVARAKTPFVKMQVVLAAMEKQLAKANVLL